MTAKKSTALVTLFYSIAIVTLLLLSALNLEMMQENEKVLGESTDLVNYDEYWRDFLAKNPNYIPGWIEVGQEEKIKLIDPNYLLP